MVTRLPAVAVAVLLLPGCGAGVETTPDDDPFELLSYNPEVSAAITPDGDGGKQEDPPGKLAGMSAELIAILAVGVGLLAALVPILLSINGTLFQLVQRVTRIETKLEGWQPPPTPTRTAERPQDGPPGSR